MAPLNSPSTGRVPCIMPIEPIGGRRIHTQVLGTNGPGVVMLHGMLLGSLAGWYLSVAPVLARSKRVLMYDMPGHGLSERTRDGYGMRRLAADLRELVIPFARGQPVTLVGHSFGGAVALRFALDYPEFVDRLVIVETPLPVVAEGYAEQAFTQLKRDFLDTLNPWQRFLVRFFRRFVGRAFVIKAAGGATRDRMFSRLPPAQRRMFEVGGRRAERLLAQMEALALDTSMLQDMRDERDIADRELATIANAVLLLYGTMTIPEMAESGRRLARVLPNARLQQIEGGHFLPWEAPAAIAAAIAAFLDA